jgi:hypothetical protein
MRVERDLRCLGASHQQEVMKMTRPFWSRTLVMGLLLLTIVAVSVLMKTSDPGIAEAQKLVTEGSEVCKAINGEDGDGKTVEIDAASHSATLELPFEEGVTFLDGEKLNIEWAASTRAKPDVLVRNADWTVECCYPNGWPSKVTGPQFRATTQTIETSIFYGEVEMESSPSGRAPKLTVYLALQPNTDARARATLKCLPAQ